MDSMYSEDYGMWYNPSAGDSLMGGSSFSPNYTGDIMKGIGTGVSMFGEYEQGVAEKGAFDFNATLDEFSAQATEAAGAETQREIGIGEESMLSTQRAIRAKSNVTQSGSPLDTALVTASNFEMSKSIASYNTQIQALKYRSQASQDQFYGQQAVNKSNTQMASTLMSGVGSIIGLAALL